MTSALPSHFAVALISAPLVVKVDSLPSVVIFRWVCCSPAVDSIDAYSVAGRRAADPAEDDHRRQRVHLHYQRR